MKDQCIYEQVLVQMFLKGYDCKALARHTGISYSTLRRKLRGESALHLADALAIQKALGSSLTLEKLFERRGA